MATLGDFETLAAAHAHTELVYPAIPRNDMIVLLAQQAIYTTIKDISEDLASPYRDTVAAFLDQSEYAFDPDTLTGGFNRQFVIDASSAGSPVRSGMTALQPTLLARGEVLSAPFANVTLYDLLVARDAVPTVPVTLDAQGYVIVSTTADCERHTPKILGFNPRVQQWQTVGRLNGVSAMGLYECRIDHPHRPWSLKVEDAYGVVAQ